MQVTNFDHCFTYINGYYEVYRHFQGDFFAFGFEWFGGGGYMEGYFHGGIYHEERISMKGAQDFLALNTMSKKTMRKKIYLEVMSSIKT